MRVFVTQRRIDFYSISPRRAISPPRKQLLFRAIETKRYRESHSRLNIVQCHIIQLYYVPWRMELDKWVYDIVILVRVALRKKRRNILLFYVVSRLRHVQKCNIIRTYETRCSFISNACRRFGKYDLSATWKIVSSSRVDAISARCNAFQFEISLV